MMATLDRPAPVNLVRSIFLCNVFNFFFSVSKACLIPFLAVYMKMLGMTATQTGVIIGCKTAVSLVFAPLWAKCAVRCGRRRCMLMFSLFMMAATYLSLTAVPSLDEQAFASRCRSHLINPNYNLSKLPASETVSTSQTPFAETKSLSTGKAKGESEETTLPSVDQNKGGPDNESESEKSGSDENVVDEEKYQNMTTTTSSETTTTTTTTALPTTLSAEDQRVIRVLKVMLKEVGIPEKELQSATKEQLESTMRDILKSSDGDEIISDALARLPDSFASELLEIMEKEAESGERRKRETDERVADSEQTESSLTSWKNFVYQKMKDIRQNMRDTENQVFAVVLVILMVGETFCAPVEKIADDGWFEFLESIDDLEKYGMQRIWSTFAFILFPFIVTLAVDNSSCVFGMSIHPFMLHFYIFGMMIGVTFLISYFYPLAISDKFKYASKVAKGVRVVCCNGRSFLFVVTLFVLGIVYASYYNFLFWQLLDMGSKEVTLGLCLTMAAMSEIPMLLFSEKMVKRCGSGAVVSISVLLVGGRCLYYSFLPTPWAVIPAELTHAFTHTAMWWAILSNSSFNTSPALSRSIRSILSTVYFGVGFAIGSFVSGLVYDVYGAAILFQAGAVLACGWFPFLCLGVRCCREKDRSEVKYTRLLAAEDASDSDSIEDDWLEKALKDK